MSRLGWGVVLLLVSLSCIAGAAVVAGDDGPLAEAGLDQTVSQGATVYLDAGGSVAPDGDIVAYEWELERPDGTVGQPACRSCERTEFTASQVGTYAVTVTVTDDQGRTDTDTLYVEVSPSETLEATLTGPDRLAVGADGTVELAATPGDRPLNTYAWRLRGTTDSHSAAGDTSWTRTVTFDEAGDYVVSATVTDDAGDSVELTHEIVVYDPGDAAEDGAGDDDSVPEFPGGPNDPGDRGADAPDDADQERECTAEIASTDVETVDRDSRYGDLDDPETEAIRGTAVIEPRHCEDASLIVRADGPGETLEQDLLEESDGQTRATFTFDDITEGHNTITFTLVADHRHDTPETLDKLTDATTVDNTGDPSSAVSVDLHEQNPTQEPSMEVEYLVDFRDSGMVSFPGSDTEPTPVGEDETSLTVEYDVLGDVQVEAEVRYEATSTQVYTFTLSPDCETVCERHKFEAVEYVTGDWVNTTETRATEPTTTEPGVRWEETTRTDTTGEPQVARSAEEASYLEAHPEYRQVDTAEVEAEQTSTITAWRYPHPYQYVSVEQQEVVDRNIIYQWQRTTTRQVRGTQWTDQQGQQHCTGRPPRDALAVGGSCTQTVSDTETTRSATRPRGSGWSRVGAVSQDLKHRYEVTTIETVERPVFQRIETESTWFRHEIQGETQYHHEDPELDEPYRIVDAPLLSCNNPDHFGEEYHKQSCTRSSFWGEWVRTSFAE